MRVIPTEAAVTVGEREQAGLVISVAGARSRPAFLIEHGGRLALRISSRGAPLAYARIGVWEEIAWLHAGAAATGVLAPITVDDMREVAGTHVPGSDAFMHAWMRRMLESISAESLLLHDGPWALAPAPLGTAKDARAYPRNPTDGLAGAPPIAWRLDAVVSPRALTRDDWACGWGDALIPMGVVWPLRAPSRDAARVRALQKRARDGLLAPALLLYVSVIGAYVVLDGHDRIAAALAEGVPPRLLALWPTLPPRGNAVASVVAVAPLVPAGPATDRLEAALRRAMAEHRHYGARTVAWPLRGGLGQWRAEARAVLSRAPATELDRDDVEFLLSD